MVKFRISLFLIALTLTAVTTHAAWTQSAYVWQRQIGPATETAMRTTGGNLSGFCLLASEIGWRNDAPSITRIPLDYAKLAALGKPIELALRIGHVPSNSEISNFKSEIIAEASAVLKAACAAGLQPAELEIDYDCAESKLADYTQLLASLRSALGPQLASGKTALTFTSLPAWLRHEAAFTALAREAAATGGGFILQVHSLDKPADIDSSITLCDPEKTLAWARRAEAIATRANARYRIALPTYGYTLGFTPEGKFIGIAAEASRDWPASTQLRTLRADPLALQELAKNLAGQNLTHADGIIWFRLPVEGDRLAWNAETFTAVVQGTPLVSRLDIEARPADEPGLFEIVINNRGHTPLRLPEEIVIEWPDSAHLAAADGLVNYTFANNPNHNPRALDDYGLSSRLLRRTDTPANAEINSGRTRVIGWMRFDFPDEKTKNTFSIHANIP